jgi:hypothetical protein
MTPQKKYIKVALCSQGLLLFRAFSLLDLLLQFLLSRSFVVFIGRLHSLCWGFANHSHCDLGIGLLAIGHEAHVPAELAEDYF